MAEPEKKIQLLAKHIDRGRLESYLEALVPPNDRQSISVNRKLDYWLIQCRYDGDLKEVRL
jgi:hypothetical protein